MLPRLLRRVPWLAAATAIAPSPQTFTTRVSSPRYNRIYAYPAQCISTVAVAHDSVSQPEIASGEQWRVQAPRGGLSTFLKPQSTARIVGFIDNGDVVEVIGTRQSGSSTWVSISQSDDQEPVWVLAAVDGGTGDDTTKVYLVPKTDGLDDGQADPAPPTEVRQRSPRSSKRKRSTYRVGDALENMDGLGAERIWTDAISDAAVDVTKFILHPSSVVLMDRMVEHVKQGTDISSMARIAQDLAELEGLLDDNHVGPADYISNLRVRRMATLRHHMELLANALKQESTLQQSSSVGDWTDLQALLEIQSQLVSAKLVDPKLASKLVADINGLLVSTRILSRPLTLLLSLSIPNSQCMCFNTWLGWLQWIERYRCTVDKPPLLGSGIHRRSYCCYPQTYPGRIGQV